MITQGLDMMIKRHLPECEVIGIAHNGLAGYDIVLDKKPDIVLTDVRMPRSDGLDMIARLRAAETEAVFIILSGYADFEYAQKAIALGVKFYATKPVEDSFFEVVQKACHDIDKERAKSANMIFWQHRKNALMRFSNM